MPRQFSKPRDPVAQGGPSLKFPMCPLLVRLILLVGMASLVAVGGLPFSFPHQLHFGGAWDVKEAVASPTSLIELTPTSLLPSSAGVFQDETCEDEGLTKRENVHA